MESAPLRAPEPTDDATFRRLVDELREGIAILDVDDLSFKYANPALLRMLGRELAGMLGEPFIDHVDAHDVAQTSELARTAAAGRIEVELRAQDGTRVPAALSFARLDSPEGAVLGVSVFNLSSQHEMMRVERERLERIGRRKDEFIAMLGHELRNPLAPLRHAAELLDGQVAGIPGPSTAELTSIIHRQVDHMARLIADLLDIGRTTTGRLPVRPQRMRVSEVIETAFESTARLLARRKHTLVRDCDVDELEIDADPVRLTQMLTNLLANAVKYSPEGGRIELSCRAQERWLEIVVRDQGIGIARDDLESIFEPFFQAGSTLDRTDGGLGIGLALVRGIVELHGGTVRAQSDGPGRGATFEVRLPGVLRNPIRAVEQPPAQVAPVSLRVLVIDDNEDAARMLALLLERRGCKVDVGFLGGDGIQMVRNELYDLAFVDIGLPDIDGYAFAEHVVREATCPRRLVALTGYGQAEDRARALASGFHEHVVKPLSPRRLDEMLASSSPA